MSRDNTVYKKYSGKKYLIEEDPEYRKFVEKREQPLGLRRIKWYGSGAPANSHHQYFSNATPFEYALLSAFRQHLFISYRFFLLGIAW